MGLKSNKKLKKRTSPSSSAADNHTNNNNYYNNNNKEKLMMAAAAASQRIRNLYNYKNNKGVALAVLIVAVVLLGITSSISRRSFFSSSITNTSAVIYGISVINEFHHDPSAFTQGLLYAENGTLFESTGLNGQSSVRRVALQTGEVEIIQQLDASYFGEGLTLLGNRLFQVLWLTRTGFIYDRRNLTKIRKFTHDMQDGWGLATDGKVLFGSDGSSTLYHLNPKNLKVIKKHVVKYNDREVRYLNELEFINGEVWANVWQTDCVARISPEDGALLGWILLPSLRTGLLAAGHNGIDVLNGIAWDSNENRIFVTGKRWPKMYEIKIHPSKERYESGFIEEICIP